MGLVNRRFGLGPCLGQCCKYHHWDNIRGGNNEGIVLHCGFWNNIGKISLKVEMTFNIRKHKNIYQETRNLGFYFKHIYIMLGFYGVFIMINSYDWIIMIYTKEFELGMNSVESLVDGCGCEAANFKQTWPIYKLWMMRCRDYTFLHPSAVGYYSQMDPYHKIKLIPTYAFQLLDGIVLAMFLQIFYNSYNYKVHLISSLLYFSHTVPNSITIKAIWWLLFDLVWIDG